MINRNKLFLSACVLLAFIGYAVAQQKGALPYVVGKVQVGGTGIPSNKPVSTQAYTDGEYTGPSVDAFYGNIQVKAVISGGKLTDVVFLDHPHDQPNSIRVNNYAMPLLKARAISIQSANVDVVSGATHSSGAFVQSLGVALAQASK